MSRKVKEDQGQSRSIKKVMRAVKHASRSVQGNQGAVKERRGASSSRRGAVEERRRAAEEPSGNQRVNGFGVVAVYHAGLQKHNVT